MKHCCEQNEPRRHAADRLTMENDSKKAQNIWMRLFVLPTRNAALQLLRYLFVGGVAFLADAGALYLLEKAGLHYLVAAAAAFLVGLTVNFLLSKKFVFTEDPRRVGRAGEFVAYGLIGLAGLAITELVMYLLTGVFGLYFMLSKIVSAAIVLLWNFAARKLILYR